MRLFGNKKALPVAVLLPISLLVACSRPKTLTHLPPVIVWAWERPEKLDFINPDRVGVAFLAKTIELEGDSVVSRPRLQPLELAPGTKLVAVVRIETDGKQGPPFSALRLEKISNEIVKVAALSEVSVVQIDCDAIVPERDFYRTLITRVRRDLPPSTALSITALASWCAGDQWLTDLPIDEAVPMLFRMGFDRNHFQSGRPFDAAICRSAAGVSTDEPVTPPSVDRLYIFNPNPWSRDSLNSALEAYKR
jgi:hypothetical protein